MAGGTRTEGNVPRARIDGAKETGRFSDGGDAFRSCPVDRWSRTWSRVPPISTAPGRTGLAGEGRGRRYFELERGGEERRPWGTVEDGTSIRTHECPPFGGSDRAELPKQRGHWMLLQGVDRVGACLQESPRGPGRKGGWLGRRVTWSEERSRILEPRKSGCNSQTTDEKSTDTCTCTLRRAETALGSPHAAPEAHPDIRWKLG